MSKDLSPEERLLRLIRSKAPKAITNEAPAALPAPSPAPAPIQPQVQAAPKPPVLTPAPVHAPIQARKFSFDFPGLLKQENLNLVLIIILAGLVMFFILVFLRSPKSPTETLGEKIKIQEKASAQKVEPPPAADQRPSFDYYSAQAGSRNIFAPVAAEETKAQAAPVEQGPKLEEVKGQLSLLGVIGGTTPQVIIEDKRTQKTYFLNKGSTFDDIEVGDIFENKVILTYKGKQFELIL